MIESIRKVRKGKGFTLLEVLIAFSLLSILFAVIIQSQADTIFFLDKTDKLSQVQKETLNELLKIERNLAAQTISSESGTYSDDHPLQGSQWQKTVVIEDFMSLTKIKKITFKITWTEGKEKGQRSFEAAILGDI